MYEDKDEDKEKDEDDAKDDDDEEEEEKETMEKLQWNITPSPNKKIRQKSQWRRTRITGIR